MLTRSRYDRHDVLVDRGRSWRPDGAEIRNYACGLNRITARISAEHVELKRKLGVVCPGVEIVLADLDALVAFLHWLEKHRTRWAAFYWTGTGHPPGWGGATAFYQRPGRVRPIRVAAKVMGKVRGEDFTGHDVPVRVDPPERVAGVAALMARVVRRGERLGDPGEEVGGVYRCGELGIEAARNSVTVRRGKHWIEIEPEEHLFLERLLLVHPDSSSPSGTRTQRIMSPL
jgi:hypothetical protein